MPVELDDQRIATGRTWRDLPESPPTAQRPLRGATVSEPTTNDPVRGGSRGLIGFVAVALLAGIAFGAWSPWESADVATITDSATAPDGLEEFPDAIVPEPPGEILEPAVPAPNLDPSDLFDGTPFADRFPGIQNDLSLIALGELPDGFRTIGSVVSQSGEEVRHQIRLLGPTGIATVRAERNGIASLPDVGDPILIDSAEGRVVAGSSITITWIIDDVLVIVQAPEEVGLENLGAIAATVEVVE